MFIVLLRFGANKSNAAPLAEGHKRWLQQGFDDGVFLLAGSLKPNLGGVVLAHATTRSDLEARVSTDPFVVAQVVHGEIAEFEPSRSAAQMKFLME